MTTKKVTPTTTKDLDNAKQNLIAQRKESLKNSEKSIFENVDFMNLEKQVLKVKVSEKLTNERKLMYKFERTIKDKAKEKQLRTKIRKQRNAFANNIILCFQKKNEIDLKKYVSEFEKFYLETYILNDFSLQSISFNNRDKDVEILLTSMLQIISFIKAN